MSDFNRGFTRPTPAVADMGIDAGLRSFMLGVYNKMALGLLISAGLAYGVAVTPAAMQFFFTGAMLWVTLFTPLALILFYSFFMRNPSPTAMNLVYWAVVASMGVSLGGTIYVYAASSGMLTIVKALVITCATFGAVNVTV